MLSGGRGRSGARKAPFIARAMPCPAVIRVTTIEVLGVNPRSSWMGRATREAIAHRSASSTAVGGRRSCPGRGVCLGATVHCRGQGHKAITQKALGFLGPGLVARIIDKNVDQDGGDTAGQPDLHFTNCLFAKSSFYIQDQYRNIMAALTSEPTPDTTTATLRWGQLLHPVQDFYSHSNWVDPEPMGLGFGTTHDGFLLDAGLANWRPIEPYQPLFSGEFADILPVEGEYSGDHGPAARRIGAPRRWSRKSCASSRSSPSSISTAA